MSHKIYHEITGSIVMIGFGSIGKGTLPLIERHFKFDKSRFVVIDPHSENEKILKKHGIKIIKAGLTKDNYKEILTPLLSGSGQSFCVNLSVDTSSVDIMRHCRELNALYIDTVIEPWTGFYYDKEIDNEKRTNYFLRETLLAEKRANPKGATAVSTCGANPGMVSWFVKQALINVATDLGVYTTLPQNKSEWALLMQKAGVKGIHIAERDTQTAKYPKEQGVFTNTWSVEGFISEGLQPAELGWGTHENWVPDNAKSHAKGSRAAIYLNQPGANTRVRSWTPTAKAQYAFLVTHNEAISIADYYSVKDEKGNAIYRPTCHYAYHPCNDAVLSLHEMFGSGVRQSESKILEEHEIVDGRDELGVLLYGHDNNAYWYGSQLTIEEARRLAPYQNATGLQVTSAVLAGMVYALENPEMGIVEADEINFQRCLEVQKQYLGAVTGHYTDWTPLQGRPSFFPEDIDLNDPWQFRNILVR